MHRTREIEFLRSVLNSLSMSILVLNKNLGVRFANRSFAESFGLANEEAEGQLLAELSNGDWDIPELNERLESVVEFQQPMKDFEVEKEFAKIGSRVMLLNADVLHQTSESGEVLILLTIDDQTDRKILERGMDLYRQGLEDANRELESFSYSVSHDLRAPLRHMSGFVPLLRKHLEGHTDEKALRYMNYIEEASCHMGLLIDELLAFSRNSRVEMASTEVDIGELVSLAREELSEEIDGRNIEWVIGDLPKVCGDGILLRQVVTNLLSNALKYTSQKESARIEIGSYPEPEDSGGHVIFFKDNGAGFDMKYKHKLFGLFQRLHHQHDFQGTGIGLANVRRIVARHGGGVWAEGAVDAGAAFYFSIPRYQKEDTWTISEEF